MSDANFASLSSTLLARKGGAKPAMRPQSALISGHAAAASVEDLGWNDMGTDEEPARDAEVLQLTPSPANPATAAQAREIDHEANDQLDAVGDVGAKNARAFFGLERVMRIAAGLVLDKIPRRAHLADVG